ncbi:MAG: RnfABCDGE type electron transport complex subunit D [Phycisphaerae bacterium]
MTTYRDHSAVMPQAPFLHAGEGARTVIVIMLAAACGPLVAGMILFGWRAVMVAGVSVGTCVFLENLYYRVTKVPALVGRSHAYLTGVLLAVTLPPFVPWYVPAVGAAFAIIVGKAVFGGIGHFLWQPALVGRLAVAAMFSTALSPALWPVLARDHLLIGDVTNCQDVSRHRAQSGGTSLEIEVLNDWRSKPAPEGKDGFLLTTPRTALAGLTSTTRPAYSAIATPQGPQLPAIRHLPSVTNLLWGAYGGGIGETCALVIIISGLYLIYRSYVTWRIPLMFVLSAAAVAALAPIQLEGPNHTVIFGWGPPGGWSSPHVPAVTQWLSGEAWRAWLDGWTRPPLLVEGLDVGFVYVSYQVLGGELMLAAFFLATEMTSRPVTSGGQAVFAIGCGVLAMLLRLYTDLPIPAYIAVLAMNTCTPVMDALWRPRVLGTRRAWWRLGIR